MLKFRIGNKIYKLDLKRFIVSIVTLIAIIFCITVAVDFCKYPEMYLTTWKYQLQNDIANGNKQAIEYYNTVYVENGIELF